MADQLATVKLQSPLVTAPNGDGAAVEFPIPFTESPGNIFVVEYVDLYSQDTGLGTLGIHLYLLHDTSFDPAGLGLADILATDDVWALGECTSQRRHDVFPMGGYPIAGKQLFVAATGETTDQTGFCFLRGRYERVPLAEWGTIARRTSHSRA